MDKFKRKSTYPNLILLNISTLLLTLHITAVTSIGVNYGTTADNLPQPTQVAKFIKTQTTIDRVKIFDMDPGIISAFANTNIPLTVTIANGDFPPLANLTAAQAWVASNIAPVYPQTTIEYILIGSEVLLWGDGTMFGTLVPAMNAVYNACVLAGFPDIKVTTAHSLGILNSSVPPSSASFLFGWQQYFLTPMLEYHRRSKSPFMVNPYPYFALNSNDTDFVLFEPNPGVFDPVTGMNYTNMYDLQLDAVYVSMKKLGFPDVNIAVGETGWPSAGDPGMVLCTVQNAQWYNLNVVKRAGSGVGTPLMPGRNFETFLFALFNEDQKTGGTIENHWGFYFGIMKQPGGGGATPTPVTPTTSGKQWCVPKKGAINSSLLANINWACTSGGVDCSAVQPGGTCFSPNTVWSHAAYIMNAYYQAKGLQFFNCDFAGTGSVTTSDPSK
ncbi:hypothetical protein RHGRI_027543 [Rhododendron griersonianum]|uniref:glucan endo-1,3-beta-D-glucosidase n=1 Tax=Rhododendron griersonianum TaxID=479676 RepID=A0AAV6IX49_9ERIC|nr:hypothetical protein RHGRI_027543 [Rhododendron griersonianum]